MGQSLSQVYIHLVFATKGRVPWIYTPLEPGLFAYLNGILNNLQSPSIEINAVPDHIHILFKLSKNRSLSKVVENLKKESSKWMKSQGITDFTWQVGYGAFSVSSSKLDTVKKYIQQQKVHHRTHTFKKEIEDFMSQYQIAAYDPNFFWN